MPVLYRILILCIFVFSCNFSIERDISVDPEHHLAPIVLIDGAEVLHSVRNSEGIEVLQFKHHGIPSAVFSSIKESVDGTDWKWIDCDGNGAWIKFEVPTIGYAVLAGWTQPDGRSFSLSVTCKDPPEAEQTLEVHQVIYPKSKASDFVKGIKRQCEMVDDIGGYELDESSPAERAPH